MEKLLRNYWKTVEKLLKTRDNVFYGYVLTALLIDCVFFSVELLLSNYWK